MLLLGLGVLEAGLEVHIPSVTSRDCTCCAALPSATASASTPLSDCDGTRSAITPLRIILSLPLALESADDVALHLSASNRTCSKTARISFHLISE